jgi:hypothetical protein
MEASFERLYAVESEAAKGHEAMSCWSIAIEIRWIAMDQIQIGITKIILLASTSLSPAPEMKWVAVGV